MQDEDQDGDLSPPWSEVVVVTKNLTSFVLNDLPPGQTILSTPKIETLEVLPPNTMLHSNPSFSPVCKAAHRQESIVRFQGKLRKICCISGEGQRRLGGQ